MKFDDKEKQFLLDYISEVFRHMYYLQSELATSFLLLKNMLIEKGLLTEENIDNLFNNENMDNLIKEAKESMRPEYNPRKEV